jgi:hypothetical protein
MNQAQNKSKLSRRNAAALLSLAPLLAGVRAVRAAEPPKDPPVFRIGALLGLTDKANWNAVVMQRGITMAVDEINAKGGIEGIKVEAAIEDHQGVPRVGVDALEDMARIVGIDTDRVSLVVFALGSAISAVAGCFTRLNEGATPTMGFYPVFVAFVVAVIGGLGSIPGSIAGGYLVGLVESLGLWKIPTEWQNSIAFVLLFAVLLARPQGLFVGQRR